MTQLRDSDPSAHVRSGRWLLWIGLLSLGVGLLIKLMKPEGEYLLNVLIAAAHGYPVYLLMLGLLRVFPRMSHAQAIALATPVGVLIGSLTGILLLRGFSGAPPETLPSVGGFVLTGLVISVIAAALFYSLGRSRFFQASLQAEQLKRAQQERLLAESRLRALQSQIEPHFLFNTLANVQALIDTDPKAAKAMLESFTRLLRHTLQRSRGGGTTLGQELAIVGEYLSLQRQRLGERLSYHLPAASELESIPFPPLLLQPLVENALKHGIEPSIAGGRVEVSVARRADRLTVEVRDSGRGFGGDTAGTGVGLANVRERLSGLYGQRGRLSLAENSPSGVIATLEVPLDQA